MAGYSSQILQMMQGERARDLAAPERGMQEFMGTASAFQNFRQQDEQMAQRNQELSLRERSFGQLQQQSDFQNQMALEDQKLQYADFGLRQKAHALDRQLKGYQISSMENAAKFSQIGLQKASEGDAAIMGQVQKVLENSSDLKQAQALQDIIYANPFASQEVVSNATGLVASNLGNYGKSAYAQGQADGLTKGSVIPPEIAQNQFLKTQYELGKSTSFASGTKQQFENSLNNSDKEKGGVSSKSQLDAVSALGRYDGNTNAYYSAQQLQKSLDAARSTLNSLGGNLDKNRSKAAADAVELAQANLNAFNEAFDLATAEKKAREGGGYEGGTARPPASPATPTPLDDKNYVESYKAIMGRDSLSPEDRQKSIFALQQEYRKQNNTEPPKIAP